MMKTIMPIHRIMPIQVILVQVHQAILAPVHQVILTNPVHRTGHICSRNATVPISMRYVSLS